MKLDLPVDAHLPSSYVGREELRLEAYRRLATVTTEAEVADIKAEWTDRYGPPPPPAEALLAVGRLRAECHRLGIREVGVARGMVRLTPIHLKASEEVGSAGSPATACTSPTSARCSCGCREGRLAVDGRRLPARAAAALTTGADESP